jgi:plastocyanin
MTMRGAAVVALAVTMSFGCGHPAHDGGYRPRGREITVTAVPLLVKELQGVYPFLEADFAKGGILEGKEVYAFVPSTIVVVQGDTIHFTLMNPTDDEHNFVLPGLEVALPGRQTTHATLVARRAGVFPLVCSIPEHAPMMSGQLVVLAPSAVEDTGSVAR